MEAEEMAMEAEGDEDEVTSGWGGDEDEVTSGWGESYEEEEAEQQAEALLPASLPQPITTPRPAMTSFAQIARGSAAEATLSCTLPCILQPARGHVEGAGPVPSLCKAGGL